MTSHKSHLPLLIFAVLGVVWGSNFIYMKMAVDLITPGQVVLYRVCFGFLPVLAYAGVRRDMRLAHARHAHHFLVMSVLATAFYYYCFAKGASLLLSGIAGAVSGAIPLFAFVMAIVFIPEEKATVRKLCGVLVALAGVVLIARPSGQEVLTTNLEGVGYMVAGSLGVGASFVYARKFIVPLHIPAAALTTYQLGFGLLILALATDTSGIGRIWTSPTPQRVSSLAWAFWEPAWPTSSTTTSWTPWVRWRPLPSPTCPRWWPFLSVFSWWASPSRPQTLRPRA